MHTTHHSKSRLRVVHNVANGPKVDGYLDGKRVLRDVSYKTISNYLEIPSGSHIVKVTVANTDKTIITGEVVVEANTAYTLIVHGLIKDPKTIAPLLLEDSLACPAPGKAHVRFVHAAAGAPAVDIYGGPAKIFSNVSYGQVGEPSYLPVPAGRVPVSVKPAGAQQVVLGPLPLTLENGGIYTVIASGIVGDKNTPLTALLSEDTHGSCVVTHH
jgi:hypothetical protein